MRVSRRLKELEGTPWWYGLAWHDIDTEQRVIFPVPLNIVASWARWLWNTLRFRCVAPDPIWSWWWHAYNAGQDALRKNNVVIPNEDFRSTKAAEHWTCGAGWSTWAETIGYRTDKGEFSLPRLRAP